ASPRAPVRGAKMASTGAGLAASRVRSSRISMVGPKNLAHPRALFMYSRLFFRRLKALFNVWKAPFKKFIMILQRHGSQFLTIYLHRPSAKGSCQPIATPSSRVRASRAYHHPCVRHLTQEVSTKSVHTNSERTISTNRERPRLPMLVE